MRHSHRAFRLVHMLTARSRGSEPVDLQLRRENAERRSRFGNGRHGNRGEGGVPTLVFVEWRDANQAVHAALEGEIGRQIVSFELENAAVAAGAFVELRNEFAFPVHFLRKGCVHREKHPSPVAGIFAPGSYVKFKERTCEIPERTVYITPKI